MVILMGTGKEKSPAHFINLYKTPLRISYTFHDLVSKSALLFRIDQPALQK